jgi:hypothetical protein
MSSYHDGTEKPRTKKHAKTIIDQGRMSPILWAIMAILIMLEGDITATCLLPLLRLFSFFLGTAEHWSLRHQNFYEHLAYRREDIRVWIGGGEKLA